MSTLRDHLAIDYEQTTTPYSVVPDEVERKIQDLGGRRLTLYRVPANALRCSVPGSTYRIRLDCKTPGVRRELTILSTAQPTDSFEKG